MLKRNLRQIPDDRLELLDAVMRALSAPSASAKAPAGVGRPSLADELMQAGIAVTAPNKAKVPKPLMPAKAAATLARKLGEAGPLSQIIVAERADRI